ncbi:MAG: pilus assembly PilX N-terminal domain-containing protein [Patescibacteria group bacterium]|jgi:hypothetical protein
MNRTRKKHTPPRTGSQLITALVVIFVFSILGIASTQYVINQFRIATYQVDRESTLAIAEAGAEYYRWHLAHSPSDFQDGTGAPGPYLHDYYNANNVKIGTFSLTIVPPPIGSTITTIQSTGYLLKNPNQKRTVVMQMGIPSFSQYAVVANDVMRFGSGTEVWGPIHSNFGIRFDGLAHNLITSSVSQYNDPDHSGGNEFGVHTHVNPVDPLPPALPAPQPPPPNRPDVFAAGRTFPVAPVNFTGITGNLNQMKADAIANGIWLPPSGVNGYHITVKNNDTVDIRVVNTLSTCRYRLSGQWYSYADVRSIATQSTFTYEGQVSLNIPLPANGLIFSEDDTWVDGQIDGGHLTIIAAEEPLASGQANIIVNNDLTYTLYDGTDTIGLIGQQNVGVGFYSDTNLRIDAALIAQNGWVRRWYYQPVSSSQWNPAGCNQNVYKNSITTFGSIATNQRYGFAYTDGTGYQDRFLNYDDKLKYGPPPSFPTTGVYTVISWEER